MASAKHRRAGRGVAASVMTPLEVADAFQVHAQTVRDWCRDGRLPAIQTPGGRFRIKREDVERFLATPAGPVPPTIESEPVLAGSEGA